MPDPAARIIEANVEAQRIAVRWMERAEAAEAERDRLREALEPFLAYPRYLSIGSHENTVEIRVSRRVFDAAQAAMNHERPERDS